MQCVLAHKWGLVAAACALLPVRAQHPARCTPAAPHLHVMPQLAPAPHMRPMPATHRRRRGSQQRGRQHRRDRSGGRGATAHEQVGQPAARVHVCACARVRVRMDAPSLSAAATSKLCCLQCSPPEAPSASFTSSSTAGPAALQGQEHAARGRPGPLLLAAERGRAGGGGELPGHSARRGAWCKCMRVRVCVRVHACLYIAGVRVHARGAQLMAPTMHAPCSWTSRWPRCHKPSSRLPHRRPLSLQSRPQPLQWASPQWKSSCWA